MPLFLQLRSGLSAPSIPLGLSIAGMMWRLKIGAFTPRRIVAMLGAFRASPWGRKIKISCNGAKSGFTSTRLYVSSQATCSMFFKSCKMYYGRANRKSDISVPCCLAASLKWRQTIPIGKYTHPLHRLTSQLPLAHSTLWSGLLGPRPVKPGSWDLTRKLRWKAANLISQPGFSIWTYPFHFTVTSVASNDSKAFNGKDSTDPRQGQTR